MILLNYTDLCVFSFGNLFIYSFFVFSGKFITLISSFATPISNFHAFSLKIGFYWLPDFNNLRARLFPDHQQSVIFNLIATYNKHFIIILKIHIFAIFRRTTNVFFTTVLF